MAERQYFRHHRLSFVRLVLVLTRGADYPAKVRMGDSLQRHCDGGLSFPVGSVHCSDVHWHVAFACCGPGRFRFADDSFLFSWRLAISLTQVLVSNSLPAMREFSVGSPRSTRASRRCSTRCTAKSSC